MMPLHSDPTLLSLSKVTGIKLEFLLHHNPKVKMKVTPKCTVVDFTIRVINPEARGMLKLSFSKVLNLKPLEQLRTYGRKYWSNLGGMWSVSC